MKTHELQDLLSCHPDLQLQVLLPRGGTVPVSFHITEAGVVQKDFLDCGGTLRQSRACQLQAWVGQDDDHRLSARKLAGILEKAVAAFECEYLPVEIEYEDGLVSQFPVTKVVRTGGSLVFHLTTKHTDCLAKELCGLPADGAKNAATDETASCCTGGGCCG